MFLSNYVPPSVQFPDHFIDPAKKNKQWHLQFCQAAYGQTFSNAYMNGRYQQWGINRLFAQGRQPFQRYVPQICGKDAENYLNINWRIVSVMPKIRDSVINYVSKITFRPTFNAIDPEAIMLKIGRAHV